MLKFFKFLGLAIKDGFVPILMVLGVSIPFIIGVISAILLKHFVSQECAAVVTFLIIIIGYWLYSVIPHYITAIKYCKKTGTDSLKEAWENTSSYVWPA